MTDEARVRGRGAGETHAGPAILTGRILGWLVVPLYVAGACAGYLLEVRAGLWDNENQAENLILIAGFGAFSVVGSLLMIRRPANPVGWIMAAIALLIGVAHAGDTYVAHVMVTRGRPDALAVVCAWVGGWYWYLALALALVYAPLTAVLVTVYVGGVIVLQYAFRTLTGQQSQLAIVASTLAIAALFSPLRRRVQEFVDRQFYRRKYDAQKTLAAYSAQLREETDLDALGDAVVGVVRAAMQPEHVSLWVRQEAVSARKRQDEVSPTHPTTA